MKKAYPVLIAFVSGLAGGLIAFLFIVASPALAEKKDSPDVLQVKSLQLLDTAGRIRAELKTTSDGNPELIFLDEQKVPLITLGIDSSGASAIIIKNQQNNMRLALTTREGGSEPAFILANPDGKAQALLFSKNDKLPNFYMYDQNLKIKLLHEVEENNEGSMKIFNNIGKEAWRVP